MGQSQYASVEQNVAADRQFRARVTQVERSPLSSSVPAPAPGASSVPPLSSIHSSSAIDEVRRRLRLDPERIRQLRTALYKHCLDDAAITGNFPFSAELRRDWLELAQRIDSDIDGASKLLLKNERGLLLEAVILRIASGRTTLCVSSQVGCAAACEFCATGKMGIAQNLTTDEILDQVLLAGRILKKEGRRLRNIVFMGMGEPFHNESNLLEALRVLTSPKHFDFSPNRLLISSVGIPGGMLRCVEQFPRVRLALSLHSVRQEIREKLIPIASKHPLDLIQSTLRSINARQPDPVMIEYLMLSGVNDSQSDADELAAWLSDLNVHVNLIPFNAIEGSPHLIPSDPESVRVFSEALKQAGLKATVRYSLGGDIAAACGQLVQQENRRIARHGTTTARSGPD